VVPEAARDVLVACAQLAVTRGITELPAGIEDETAASMESGTTWGRLRDVQGRSIANLSRHRKE
jgi:hypothetical protein